MHIFYLISGAIALYWLFRKPAATAVGPITPGQSPQWQAAQAIASHDPNLGRGGGDGATIVGPAGTKDYTGYNPYPGWFRTKDGSWVNPDTAMTISPGGSPPVVARTYDNGLDRPDFSGLLKPASAPMAVDPNAPPVFDPW